MSFFQCRAQQVEIFDQLLGLEDGVLCDSGLVKADAAGQQHQQGGDCLNEEHGSFLAGKGIGEIISQSCNCLAVYHMLDVIWNTGVSRLLAVV